MAYRYTALLIGMLALLGQARAQTCKPLEVWQQQELQQAQALAAFKASAFTGNYDVKFYRLHVWVDPRAQYVRGENTMYFTTLDAGFAAISLDLAITLQVDSVLYHGDTLAFSQLSGDELKISLPQALGKGVLDSVTVFYHGVPQSKGLGSFRSAPHNSGDGLWTLSQPYGSKEWWPGKMTLNDKADSIDVLITCPQQYRGASNGLLVSDVVTDTMRTVVWQHRYPIASYLVAVGVSNYAVYSDYWVHNGDSLQILNYIYPHYLAQAKTESPYTAQCLELYSNLFEDYPFRKEKYGHAQFGQGGGMEHQTMSFMYGLGADLLAHELAHQWFGDKLTCGSWRDLWLNEGFATYLTGLTQEHLHGDSLWMKWKRDNMKEVLKQPYGSVYPVDTVNVFSLFDSRLTYSKGAYVLHMLRWTMGDDKFFKGVRNYLKDASMAYGFSSTDKFRQQMELAVGRSLTDFFNQWYYGQGYPSYTVEWQQADDQVKFTISQNTSHTSVPFFAMPVPLLLRGGSDSLWLRLDHTKQGQTFQAQVPFKIDSVVFDPQLWILSKNNTVISKAQVIRDAELIKVYPNPLHETVKISFRNSRLQSPLLELVDVLGRTVLSEQLSGVPYLYEWNLRGVSDGTYLLRITSANGTFSKRLVKY